MTDLFPTKSPIGSYDRIEQHVSILDEVERAQHVEGWKPYSRFNRWTAMDTYGSSWYTEEQWSALFDRYEREAQRAIIEESPKKLRKALLRQMASRKARIEALDEKHGKPELTTQFYTHITCGYTVEVLSAVGPIHGTCPRCGHSLHWRNTSKEIIEETLKLPPCSKCGAKAQTPKACAPYYKRWNAVYEGQGFEGFCQCFEPFEQYGHTNYRCNCKFD